MISDADLARMVSGDMDDAERADLAERVRRVGRLNKRLERIIELSQRIVALREQMLSSEVELDTLIRAEAAYSAQPCPSHGPDMLLRDGVCLRCGAQVP